jgi:hypothetical protein
VLKKGVRMIYQMLYYSGAANILILIIAVLASGDTAKFFWKLWVFNLVFGFALIVLINRQQGN